MLNTIKHIQHSFQYSQQVLAKELTDMARKIVAERGEPVDDVLVTQSDLSRLTGEKSRLISDAIRRWIVEHPEPWIRLLASDKGDEILRDYEGIFVFRPGTFSPRDNRLPALMWKIARLPTECVSVHTQSTAAYLLRHGPTETWYWVPRSRVARVRTMLQALQAPPHELTSDELARVRVVAAPETFGMTPVAIVDPLNDDRLGFSHFTSRRAADLSITFSVMAEDVTTDHVMLLEPIYRDLVATQDDPDGSRHVGTDGFTWTAVRGDTLIERPAG